MLPPDCVQPTDKEYNYSYSGGKSTESGLDKVKEEILKSGVKLS